jgi:hypothetical protein
MQRSVVMIGFEEDSRGLVFEYEVEINDPEWVSKRLKQDGEVTVMMDILTYDDLLRRLDNIIASLTRRKKTL